MNYLTYIEATGDQYINTGVYPTHNTRLVIDMDIAAQSTRSALFGARSSYGNSAFCLFARENGSGFEDDFGAETKNLSGTSSGRHLIDKNKNVLSIDGTAVHTATNSTFTCFYPVTLFTINQIGGIMDIYPTAAKLYSCQIYNGNSLVRDFAPARNDDGTIGLYDKVNGVFYANAGSGSFTPGETLVEMYSARFTGLTNGSTYHARVYPVNPEGYAQSEIGTQTASAVPQA